MKNECKISATLMPPDRKNNFDLLRLVLAVLVLMSHGRDIFGLNISNPLFHQAELAVNGFFIISGFLISWSIDRSFEVKAYAVKRFARIYPLYAVVISTQIVLLWHFNSQPTELTEMTRYAVANFATLNFIQPWFGDMVSEPINGSLWTIKVEIMFYLAIPFYIWFLHRFGLPFLLFSFACAFAYRFGMEAYSIQWARQIPGSMAFFIAGCASYFYGGAILTYYRRNWRSLTPLLAAFAILIAASVEYYYAYRLTYIIALTAIIYSVAFHLPRIHLPYDISYGVYLWHVPVFLTLRHIEFYASQPLLAFGLASLLILLLALASYRLIELPMIEWGRTKARKWRTTR